MPDLIQFVYECGDREITVVARTEEEAFDKAEREAAALNLHDERLRLVDEFPFDPSGGDGPED
jgi:hypothetical protein